MNLFKMNREPLLSIENLSVDFTGEHQTTHAVKNVSLHVHRGEILALVGESGSGKSVTSLSILKLLPQPPAKFSSGKILFNNDNGTVELLSATSSTMQKIRGNNIGMIFQEPMTSLNPVMSCGKQVMEALDFKPAFVTIDGSLVFILFISAGIFSDCKQNKKNSRY